VPELASRTLLVGTIVASLDESRFGGGAAGLAGAGEAGSAMVTSGGTGTPIEVIVSESSAGFGTATELSPLETAVPSCALRDARSASSPMVPTVCLVDLTCRRIPPKCQVSQQYILLS
jgi:hypothetical protein